jgi:hypothetical protein
MSNDADDTDDIDEQDNDTTTNDDTIQTIGSSSTINGAVDASSSSSAQDDKPLMSLPRQKQQQQPYKAIGGSVKEIANSEQLIQEIGSDNVSDHRHCALSYNVTCEQQIITIVHQTS